MHLMPASVKVKLKCTKIAGLPIRVTFMRGSEVIVNFVISLPNTLDIQTPCTKFKPGHQIIYPPKTA